MQPWQTHKKVSPALSSHWNINGQTQQEEQTQMLYSVHSAMANTGFPLLGVCRTAFCLPCDRGDQDFSEGALTRTLRGNKDLSFMSGKHGSLDADP